MTIFTVGALVPGLRPHDDTPGAPIWSDDQAKDVMTGIS